MVRQLLGFRQPGGGSEVHLEKCDCRILGWRVNFNFVNAATPDFGSRKSEGVECMHELLLSLKISVSTVPGVLNGRARRLPESTMTSEAPFGPQGYERPM